MPRTTALAFVALLPGFSSPAQPADPPRPVKSRVESVGAEVEVLVLDAAGKPVAGLGKADLKLFVNGRETPIDYLEAPAVVGTSPVGAAAGAAPAPARPAHSTVFVVNPLHLDARSRQNGLAAMRKYADGMAAGEAGSVFVIDNGLRRLVAFTSDRKDLGKAIDRAGKGLPMSYNFDVGSEEWVARSRQELRSLATLFESVASRPEAKTAVLLAGALSATGTISPIGGEAGSKAAAQNVNRIGVARDVPGSHAVGKFSENRDESFLIYDRASAGDAPAAMRGLWSFLPELNAVASAALLAHATVVAVDPTEMTTNVARAETNSLAISGSLFDSNSSLRDGATPVEGGVADPWESRNDSFALLADETGGARIGYTNKPADHLLAESGRLASRYRLGFTPPDPTSARRTIRVEIARPGLVVRTAAGQRSVTPETAARARFAALLMSVDAPKGDFAIAVETKGPVANRTDDALLFDVLVPVSGVFAEDTPGGRRAKLELLVSAVDAEGRASDPVVIPFSATLLKEAAVDGAFFRKDANFNIDRRWKGRLFVGVRDTATNRIGAAALPLGI